MSEKSIKAEFETIKIPTYCPSKPEGLPMFFENKPYQGSTGKLYPIPYTVGISDEVTDVPYNACVLENEYLRVEVLPEIGGKVQRALDKTNGYDFIYYNKVIKPAMVGLAGPWVSGGIEFNWPQHHRPTTFMPLEARITENADGSKTAWVGETEPLNRMKGMAGITLEPGKSYFRAKVQIYNRTPYPMPVMWWANLAVEINDNYRVVFPPDTEYVNDHDRRAVLNWPIAKGVYNSARPFDFGDGTDISNVSEIKVPSSYLISRFQSDADFIAGYDLGKEAGTVTVADHHISPGKKFWHWGDHPFGYKWCANLTDDGSRYIELMTGVYTDNQPDFTWLAPYESRTFDQYWYGIRDIGKVKNATIDAAVNIEKRGNKIFVGFNTTADYKACDITVKCGDKVIFTDTARIAPDAPYTNEFDGKGIDEEKLSASLVSDGKTLVSYKAYIRGSKKPIDVRLPVKPPKEIETVEELYLNGYHLEQYKHFAHEPADYYLEALSREPGDSRCNTQMGNIHLKAGEFEKAVEYYDKAIARLTIRNVNPEDTEALYHKGIALSYLGDKDCAYDYLFRSAWSYKFRSAAYYALAQIDCLRGDFALALEKLEISLSTNSLHMEALLLKSVITGDKSILADIDRIDPLFFAKTEKPEYAVDRAIEYVKAGYNDLAIEILKNADQNNAAVLYYLAYITGDKTYVKKADAAEWRTMNFARLDDIAVLKSADSARANYYLGCLYYDRRRWDDAREVFEKSAQKDCTFAPVFRNLALCYFDRFGDYPKAKAAMHKAFELLPDEVRIFHELVWLYKNGGESAEARLTLHEKYADISIKNDNCTLDKAVLLTILGRYDEAESVLLSHRFHSYEGGEGGLTRQHAWLKALVSKKLIEEGKYSEAAVQAKDGFTFPACYGEEKNIFAQESHINYYLGLALEKTGDALGAKAAFEAGTHDNAAPTEISYFRALCYDKLGMKKEAEALLSALEQAGDRIIANKEVKEYYAVGAYFPEPFDFNYAKRNEIKGLVYKAYAKLGKGDKAAADGFIATALKLNPTHFAGKVFELFSE